jgi:hypothetical protein
MVLDRLHIASTLQFARGEFGPWSMQAFLQIKAMIGSQEFVIMATVGMGIQYWTR